MTPRVSPPVTLQVIEYGDRTSSTHLVLVHGFPDDQTMWEPVVASLPDDWHVITYDVRGSGRSSQPEGRSAYRTELLVEDLIAVLHATVPADEQIHLVGHDWGSTAMWDVVAAETWDPRLEGRLASYTSASGPSLDHLGSMSETWRGKLRMLPQTVHSWYIWLFLVPWLPEQTWSHFQWFVRRTARLLDPTIDLLVVGPRGPEQRQAQPQPLPRQRGAPVAKPTALAYVGTGAARRRDPGRVDRARLPVRAGGSVPRPEPGGDQGRALAAPGPS